MDLEDELPSPAASPVALGNGVAPLPVQADIELAKVLADFGTLPAIVTPVRDPQGELVVTPAEYRVPDIQGGLFVVPAGPTVMSPKFPQPSTGSVGCSSVPPTIPAVSTPEESLLLLAPEMSQGQPWVGPLSGGESAGSHFPDPSSGDCVSSRQ